MKLRKAYLTIDDSPSIHMDKKVAFLKKQKIPAIFYARGEFIEKHPKQVINAIDNDFLIGNHSYTHPYFSKIAIEQCFEEILVTEKLINECYTLAKKERPCKIIRLPFGDRGAGAKTKLAQNKNEKDKVQKIQYFLAENHFIALNIHAFADDFIDSYWDWDTEDYKTKHISKQKLYLENIRNFFDKYKKDTAVILLHDFDTNHHLFELSMKFLIEKNIKFLKAKTQVIVT